MRRVLGGFISIAIALPMLVGVTVAVGMGASVMGGDFMSRMSSEVIAEVPQMADDFFAAAQQPDALDDEEDRRWAAAAAAAGLKPSRLMDETGITRWLEEDLAAAMADLDRAMRGELAPDEVAVDLRPLQAAVQSEKMRAAVGRVLEQLPPCSAQDLQRWQELVPGAEGEQDMPACNPGPEALAHSRAVLIAAASEMPARMPLFQAGQQPPAFLVPAWLRACVWLAFVAPLLFLALGAWLAGRGAAGFWSWFGGIALSAGALVLLVIWIAGGMLKALMQSGPGYYMRGGESAIWNSDAGRLATEKMAGVMDAVASVLFASVQATAAGVGLVGLLAIGLGIWLRRRQDRTTPPAGNDTRTA
jgi:hypothetical protein